MCKFFSCISDGKGKVLFFTLDQIQEIQKQGNPENYDWNSHTSIAHYNGIEGEQEDKWNKWEYDSEKKELNIDGEYNAKDDSEQVKKIVKKYLVENNVIYCNRIYNNNTGNSNTGNCNTGDRNTGDRNTGDRNTGDSNTGDRNTGHSNTGNWNTGNSNTGNRNTSYWNTGNSNTGHSNTGNWNTGNRNTGNRNTGNWNTGNRNTGNRNTGNRNTGNRNTGDSNTGHSNTSNWNIGHSNTGNWNTGNRNTGNWNTGDWNTGYLNTTKPDTVRIFNKEIKIEKDKIIFPDYFYFDMNMLIYEDDMTKQEKKEHPEFKTIGGYIKIIEYKDAWKQSFDKADKEDIAKTLKMPNFDYKIFEEISGITKEMIDKKLSE